MNLKIRKFLKNQLKKAFYSFTKYLCSKQQSLLLNVQVYFTQCNSIHLFYTRTTNQLSNIESNDMQFNDLNKYLRCIDHLLTSNIARR